MTDTVINQATLDGAKLVLCSGDTLAVMAPGTLTPEQIAAIKQLCAESMPAGVKAIVLEGGVTLAAIQG